MQGGRGGSAPPHHHNGGAYALTGYGPGIPANMTTGGPNTPLHHHQQHQLQMQQHAYNIGNQQAMMNAQHQQMVRRGGVGKVVQGAGQYPYPAYPTTNANGGRGEAQQDADFALDLKRIGDDVEMRTTVMVRKLSLYLLCGLLFPDVICTHN